MKRAAISLLVMLMLLLAACGAVKVLHCDRCGAEVTVRESSKMEEDWIVLCFDCTEEMGSTVTDTGE